VVRDAAYERIGGFRNGNRRLFPTLAVGITFKQLRSRIQGESRKCKTKSYAIYRGVVPDEDKGPSLDALSALGWKVEKLRKRIQKKVKDTGSPVSRDFLVAAISEAEFTIYTRNPEKKLFDSIVNGHNGQYVLEYHLLSYGDVYASARGSCSCWWMFIAVLFHLGCSHFIIFKFCSRFGTSYFAFIYALFGSQAAAIIRIWWIALWAGFDGSMLHYGNHGRIEVILPRGQIARWFTTEVLKKAFPTLHFYERTQPSEVGDKDITILKVHRKKDVGKMARMILWAVKDFDGTEWGVESQNCHFSFPNDS